MLISLSQAISLIFQGHIIAVPTDTVYGLAASFKNPQSIKNIFELKKRPNTKPLVIQIATEQQLKNLVQKIPRSFEKIKKFWPGPLTIIFEANLDTVPTVVRAGGNTVAIRISNHKKLRSLIQKTGPLAIPSANISNEPSATTAKEVEKTFGAKFPILEGEVCSHSKESTIIHLFENHCQILREGILSTKDLSQALPVK